LAATILMTLTGPAAWPATTSWAIVRCAGHRRQAHNAANIPPTCLMSRRASPRLWVHLRACSTTPTGASG